LGEEGSFYPLPLDETLTDDTYIPFLPALQTIFTFLIPSREITGDKFKCTIAFDRAILDLESTAMYVF